MDETQQSNEVDITDIKATRKAILQTKRDIGITKDKIQRLERDFREKRDWLRGHQLNEQELRSRGLLHTHKEHETEAESLRQQIADSKQLIQQMELNLRELESVNFAPDKGMAIAIADYRETSADVKKLQEQESSFLKEITFATEALNGVTLLLNKAKAAKKNSLSLSDVSKASEDELSAKRQVDELESLVKNLDEALRPIPGKLTAKIAALKTAEAMVWNAKLNQMLFSAQENPEFAQVFEFIEMAFAAWIKAGRTNSVEQFLKESFVSGGLLRVDQNSITARQTEMANEMGLPA